jgi:hypothetical protein
MKMTLDEQKARIKQINEQISNMSTGFKPIQNNEQNLYADDYGAKKDLEQLQRDEMGYR